MSDRMNVGQEVIDKHYDQRSEEVKAEQRREYIEGYKSMDRTDDRQRSTEVPIRTDTDPDDVDQKPEVEPDSWKDLTEFVDQFDDAVFGVLADPDEGAAGFWIVEDISKVRPAAVPLGDPATFDLAVLGPGGKVVDEVRFTIEEIEYVRAAEASGVPPETDDGEADQRAEIRREYLERDDAHRDK